MSHGLDPRYLDQIVDALSVGMLVVDQELRVHLWNRWMEDHSGLSESEVSGKRLHEIFPDLTLTALQRKVRQVLTLGSSAFFDARVDGFLFAFENEQRLSRRFRHMQQDCVLVPLARGEEGSPLVCISIYDATNVVTAELLLEESNVDLEKRSQEDSLTGLFNRGYILELLDRELKRARRYGSPLSISLLDIDRFKSINDRFGHQEGDRVLVEVSRSLEKALRETDFVGRYGGEEFLVLMPSTEIEAGHEVAERMREVIASMPACFEGESYVVTASFGVALSSEPHAADALLLAADRALYRAKRLGRDRVELADLETPV